MRDTFTVTSLIARRYRRRTGLGTSGGTGTMTVGGTSRILSLAQGGEVSDSVSAVGASVGSLGRTMFCIPSFSNRGMLESRVA